MELSALQEASNKMKRFIRACSIRFSLGLLLVFTVSAIARSEDITLSTDYSSPVGNYDELNVVGTLTVGESGSPGTLTLIGNLLIQKAPGSTGQTADGNLSIDNGDLSITDTAGNTLLFTDAANNRVGVGTNTPQMTLDVAAVGAGMVRSVIIQAYADADNLQAGFLEMWSGADINDTSFANDRLSAACWTGWTDPGTGQRDYDALPIFIDGDPLVLQGALKGSPSSFFGGGFGQVVIKGEPIGSISTTEPDTLLPSDPLNDPTTILIVGFPTATYGEIRANVIPGSSMAYKKDISPLTMQDYSKYLSYLSLFTVARFRHKSDSSDKTLQLGFIAEETPQEIRSGKAISVQQAYGYLLAVAKALRNEQEDMRERIEHLQETH